MSLLKLLLHSDYIPITQKRLQKKELLYHFSAFCLLVEQSTNIDIPFILYQKLELSCDQLPF